MENCLKGLAAGLVIGMVVGGTFVAKNKKVAGKIRSFICDCEEKVNEAKEMAQEKIDEICSQNQDETDEFSSKKDLNKKMKNQ